MDELVSVLMCVYNEDEAEIRGAIESILNQTYSNIEFIIVLDDILRTDVDQIIHSYSDSRIIYIKNPKHIGLALSLNKASEFARGNMLARMDADDISFEGRLESEIRYLNNSSFDYVCTRYQFIDEYGEVIKRNIIGQNTKTINAMLPFANTIHHPTVMIKKEVFNAAKGYRSFQCAQDYDLWLRLFDLGYKVGIVDEVLYSYRIRPNNISSRNRLIQYYSQVYARKLHRERCMRHYDSFSEEEYDAFLNSKGANNTRYVEMINIEMNKKNEYGIFRKVYLILRFQFFRQYYWDALKYFWARKCNRD